MNTLKIRETTLQAGRPKIAVPLVSADPKEIIEECEKVRQMPCQIIEWRADKYIGAIDDLQRAMEEKEFYLDLIKILDDINYIADGMPVIFTLRTKAQGGDLELSREHTAQIQTLVAQSELADFVDVELFDSEGKADEAFLRGLIDEIHSYGCRVILSHHDFEKMPEPVEIVKIVSTMANLGADVYKTAAMALSAEDAEKLLKATAFLNKNEVGPIITVAMGEYGKAARVAAGRYGSCITFASGLKESAPGQVDVHTMQKWLDDYYGKEEE